MTRRAAGLDPGGWDDEARAGVAGFFGALAPDWHTRDTPERRRVVEDALARGLAGTGWEDPLGIAVEVGSGTGTYSPLVAEHAATVVAVEIAEQMLRLAPPRVSLRLLADAGDLPLVEGAVDAFVLVNAFLFPAEVARLLRPGGVLVWVNSSGPDTPIHLSTEEVVRALPFAVDGVEAGAGVGTWCALRRTP